MRGSRGSPAAPAARREKIPRAGRAFTRGMSPLLAAALLAAVNLAAVREAAVVVVRGSADHMEQVLDHARVKYLLVSPEEVAELPLHGQQVLMVNCTGNLTEGGLERVRRFVNAGGYLYTTDHAVLNTVERAFPGYIRWTRETTQEHLVDVRLQGKDRGLLRHLGARQRWQMAGGGYPFEIIDPHKVETLMRSNEGPLAVRFRVGDGQVIHVTGHFFTQPGQSPALAQAGRSFEQFSVNVVEAKLADSDRIDSLYAQQPKQAAQLRAAPGADAAPVASAAGAPAARLQLDVKLRVLERKGDYARVRDAEGNEGWVTAASF